MNEPNKKIRIWLSIHLINRIEETLKTDQSLSDRLSELLTSGLKAEEQIN